ncbi:MAG: hypothetical protein NTX92_09365, partial [Euryarchaeota archaeon]|nr:hypothetical protein [Euryarchaeota archaeon]
MCKEIDEKNRKNVDTSIKDLSKKGYRTLAVARSTGDDADHLQFLGLVALADPLRPDSKSMIE